MKYDFGKLLMYRGVNIIINHNIFLVSKNNKFFFHVSEKSKSIQEYNI